MTNQKGIAPLLILVALAVILIIGVIVFGFFVTSKTTQNSQNSEVHISQPDPQRSTIVGTPECPELDYTGCDTTGDFMTWDGKVITPSPSSQSTIILK
jgi:hypothetical protein